MATRDKKNLWYLLPLLVLVLALTLILTLPNGLAPDIYTFTRLTALLGYQFIFLAVLSAAFTRPLVRTFGRPFVMLHHLVALSGLTLIAAHPMLAAISWGDAGILLPRFDSLANFAQWAGAPALLLLLLAVLAAAFRTHAKTAWQVVHMLAYVAFLLGTMHATTATFTTDLWVTGVRIIAWLLALAAIAVFALRRTTLRPKRRPASRPPR